MGCVPPAHQQSMYAGYHKMPGVEHETHQALTRTIHSQQHRDMLWNKRIMGKTVLKKVYLKYIVNLALRQQENGKQVKYDL